VKLPPWVKKHKKAILITAGLPVAVPLLYIADVWLLGTLAASIHDISWSMKAYNILASPEEIAAAKAHGKALSYVTKHPVQTAIAWLEKPARELTHPDVRKIWLWLNLLLVFLVPVAIQITRSLKGGKRKNNSKFSHGLEVADSAAHGTSRWAAKGDIKYLCEFGPPLTPQITKKGEEHID